MKKYKKTGKRLHLAPLIAGSYGAFLGLGLAVLGLAEIKEGIGLVRLLLGLGMAGFGFWGIWDGVRDLVKPKKKPEQAPALQFILTDTSKNRTSLVTAKALREQLCIIAEDKEPKRFELQILPYFSAENYGQLKSILCIYQGNILMAGIFDQPEGGYRVYRKTTDLDGAEEWLKQLLAGSPDFSGWVNREEDASPDFSGWVNREEDAWKEGMESFKQQLFGTPNGQMTYWHQILVIFGESWHDEHKFFSARDVELAIEGIHEGKYTKVFLEWGTNAFDLFPGVQNDLMVIWCTNNTGKGESRFLAREGTVTQVKFWLVNYLNHGFFEEMRGWADVTAQIESLTAKMEKEKRKGRKKHGKVF